MRVHIEELREPLYLMPLTVESVLLYHILKNHGITASGFLDNDTKLHGKAYNNCEITSPGSSDIAASGATIILCSKKYYQANGEQLSARGVSNIVKLEQVLKKDDVKAALGQIDADSLHELNPKQTKRLPLDLNHYKRYYILPDSALGRDALILGRVELVLTERCTLKCKGCANLMQYFKEPRHLELTEVCGDLDVVMKNVDFIDNLNIIGGEPLIYKQLPEVMSHIIKHSEKIGIITLVTNGTVVPGAETIQKLKAAGVTVEISDYGSLSSKLDTLIQALTDVGVEYSSARLIWRDVQRIVTDDADNGQKKYKQCMASCNNIKQGRFYRCPFLAHGDTLNAFPRDKGNYVTLDETCTKEAIRSYLEKDTAPPGCGYCSGYASDAPVIPLAEQIKAPLEYHVFNGE